MRFVVGALCLGLAVDAAHAAGGASCTADDDKVGLDIQAGVTHGMGSPVFSLAARMDLKDQAVPEDLRSNRFTREEMPQYWLDSQDLRFRFYRERDKDGSIASVEAVLTLKSAGDDIAYEGDYLVSVFDAGEPDSQPLTFEGKVTCEVE